MTRADLLARLSCGAAVIGGMGVGAAAFAGSAEADTAKGTPLHLSCDDGRAYDVLIVGRGDFTPAQEVGSTAVFRPVAFGDATLVVIEGREVVRTEVWPGYEHGSGRGPAASGRVVVVCSYSMTFTAAEDPTLAPGQVATLSSSVTGSFTPARR